MLFDKKTTEEEIKLQLADLSVRLVDVRKQVGELTEELDRLADRFRAAKGKSDEYERYAKKAIAAGSPDDAKIFLAEKHKFDLKLEKLDPQVRSVTDTRKKAMELHDHMVREINEAKTRLAVLQARNSAADVSMKYSKTVGSSDFEQKISQMEAQSELDSAMEDARNYVRGDKDEP